MFGNSHIAIVVGTANKPETDVLKSFCLNIQRNNSGATVRVVQTGFDQDPTDHIKHKELK